MLKVLPAHISNLIAAGEVVQRPASVVKELMENGVDAGASSIIVNIVDSGKTVIQVVDDGVGMDEKDARLAFERHATSKISEVEDLHAINSFGFRGEALASIAAVSEVSLKTRRRESEIGYEVLINGSDFISSNPISTKPGSIFTIRNLFYNVPARRKFLKSDNAEFRQIISEFSRVALTNPDIAFELTHNGKIIYSIRKAPNLKQRIIDVSGKELIKELVEISTTTSVVSINGFVGKPEDAKKSSGNQYMFVNGRFFRSSYLHKAIMRSYEKLIPEGYIPSYFIYLESDPHKIDVNIHPQKTEVKFEDESLIFDILNASVREALGKNSFMPSIDFDRENAPEISTYRGDRFVPPPKIDFDPLFNPFDEEKKNGYSQYSQNTGDIFGNRDIHPDRQFAGNDNTDTIFDGETSTSRQILVIKNRFIITPVKSGMLLISVHRAKERILYERYLSILSESRQVIQSSLFPQTVKLDINSHSTLMDAGEQLKFIGFDIRDIGDNCVVVYGMPVGFQADTESVIAAIDGLIDFLNETSGDLLTQSKENIALALSKSGVGATNCHISEDEAQLLVDSIFACREPERDPQGRLCMSIITTDELLKRL